MGVSRSRDDYRLGEPVIQEIYPFFHPTLFFFAWPPLPRPRRRRDSPFETRDVSSAGKTRDASRFWTLSRLIVELAVGGLSSYPRNFTGTDVVFAYN